MTQLPGLGLASPQADPVQTQVQRRREAIVSPSPDTVLPDRTLPASSGRSPYTDPLLQKTDRAGRLPKSGGSLLNTASEPDIEYPTQNALEHSGDRVPVCFSPTRDTGAS